MARAKGAFTVIVKRPKRHLLNKCAAAKPSWVDAIAPGSDRASADANMPDGHSSDLAARSTAEKLVSPRTLARPKILHALAPISDLATGLDEALSSEPNKAMARSSDVEGDVVPIDAEWQEEGAEVIVIAASEPVRVKRHDVRAFAKREFPAGQRWMRLLPQVSQERALPKSKKMQNGRASSLRRHRTDEAN